MRWMGRAPSDMAPVRRRVCIDVLTSNQDPDDVIILQLSNLSGHTVRPFSCLKPSARGPWEL